MKLICCNFKMNLLEKDIETYLTNIKNNVRKNQVIFFPSIPHIKLFYNKGYLVGSQDISFQEFGSITGDTSILQLKELGITYTIVGHSERRKYFNDDKYISKKINLAFRHNVKVILCIGESIKSSNIETNLFLKEQIDNALKDIVGPINEENLIIAYEPVWAIGSGMIPNNNFLEETIAFIKKQILETYHLNLKVLYGGSVKLDNIDSLEKIKNIDGYLIGGASLNPEKFLSLISRIN